MTTPSRAWTATATAAALVYAGSVLAEIRWSRHASIRQCFARMRLRARRRPACQATYRGDAIASAVHTSVVAVQKARERSR
jgi:hypothetical protein